MLLQDSTRRLTLALGALFVGQASLVGCAKHSNNAGASSAYALPEAKNAGPPAPVPQSKYAQASMPTPTESDHDGIPDSIDNETYVRNEEVVAVSGSGGSGGATPTALPAVTSPTPNDSGKPLEMFDVEARLTLEVEKVDVAREAIRKLTKDAGGNVSDDELSTSGTNVEANFELRIPSSGIDAFLAGLEGVGTVEARDVKARDIGKEYHDDLLLLANLEATMKRYQEILDKAKDVKEILAIENELSRLRGEIDQVKGNLTWLKDRAARSTVYVRLVPKHPEELGEPEAKFFPGLRTTYMLDARGEGDKERFLGFGVSLQFGRNYSIDIDAMRRVGDGGALDGLQAFMATMGGDIYSDFLGGGRRRWLNPYLGARAGYARILSRNEAVVAGVVGLELFKSKMFLVDAQVRLNGFFGNPNGAHVGLQPVLALNLAF